MFEQDHSLNRERMNECSFRQLLRQNVSWFFVLTQENGNFLSFHYKSKETGMFLYGSHWIFQLF